MNIVDRASYDSIKLLKIRFTIGCMKLNVKKKFILLHFRELFEIIYQLEGTVRN